MEQITIEDGIYDSDLLANLWRKKADPDFNQQLLSLLQRLCKRSLLSEPGEELDAISDSEKQILLTTEILTACNNKEIRARWCDYVQEFDKQKRPTYLKLAALVYFEIFAATQNYEYVVRGLQLIRKAKELFTKELDYIYKQSAAIIQNSSAPYWITHLLQQLVSIFGDDCRRDFTSFIEEKVIEMTAQNKYENARHYIDALHIIGSLTKADWHIRRAENFESEGDQLLSEKPANTYYPNLSKIFLNALREIYSIPDCEAQRKRLEVKVAEAAAENYDMIRRAGVAMTPPVDHKKIQETIAGLNIDSFESGYTHLLQLPVVPERIINDYTAISKSSSSPLMDFFSGTEKINQYGAKVGTAAGEEPHINNARRFHRERNIVIIRCFKNLMDIFKVLDRPFVFQFIYDLKSRFIPDDRTYIFAEGLYEGFQNNCLTATHLLMPQIENSFRHIASQNGVQTTKWTAELQHQRMFVKSLEKIKEFTNNDLYSELHHFLADTDTNFRNEICHGLMPTALVDYYGPYFWWLTLKLVVQTEQYFSFPKD